jgi:cobyrinic acid a,c-diamide synthase
MHDKLQGMGYREATLFSDSLLGPRGATVRGHEFHYSSCVLESDVEAAYLVDGVPEGYAAGNLFASYIHLHFAGYPAVGGPWRDPGRADPGARHAGGPPKRV